MTPTDLVRAFLRAMEARELDRAAAMLAPGFRMRFPGAAPMTDLAALVAWSRDRYREVAKTFHGIEEAAGGRVVWAHGTLAGLWTDGTPFRGIRFADRFEVERGRIARQDVWNDMALHMPGRPA